jgi:hypothetical protein
MDKDDETFDEDDESIFDEIRLDDELYTGQLELHPEYREFLATSRLDDTYYDEAGQEVNPRLHLMTHVVLEKQILSNDPPFVRQTVERMEARGDDPHEVRHAIMGVLVGLMWQTMTQQTDFDVAKYKQELTRL